MSVFKFLWKWPLPFFGLVCSVALPYYWYEGQFDLSLYWFQKYETPERVAFTDKRIPSLDGLLEIQFIRERVRYENSGYNLYGFRIAEIGIDYTSTDYYGGFTEDWIVYLGTFSTEYARSGHWRRNLQSLA